MSSRILVYGWYNQGNLGDDLFIECFKKILPSFDFIFTNKITSKHLLNIDAVFFGGGSFLTDNPQITDDALPILKRMKIFYIGVGAETKINPLHQELIKLAKLIAIRSLANLELVKKLNTNIIVIPDLVYCLSSHSSFNKIKKSILVIPNILVVPKWNSPHYMHVSWDYFKTEFSQALDEYCLNGYKVNFYSMCINDQLNDHHASIEIINKMTQGRTNFLLPKENNIEKVLETISQYELVITQRYHGFILSNLASTNCLTIHHHDKLKNTGDHTLSYYGFSKGNLIEKINTIKSTKILPIDRDIFSELDQIIIKLVE